MPISTSTSEYAKPIPRPIWLAARARNAIRRPVFIGAVGLGTFVAVLVALVLAPQQARRAAQASAPVVVDRPDTTTYVAAIAQARKRAVAADSALAQARAHPAATQIVDTLSGASLARRDSLSAAVSDLNALLTRVETAPLSASYRALAESPQLVGSARVKALVDSLAEIDKDREGFGANGGADPVFVALTSRATEIGRSIETIAQQRRDDLRAELAKINAPERRQLAEAAPAVDTASWIAERDSALSMFRQARTELGDAREKVQEYDRQTVRAREMASMSAPPVALLAAALVFAVVIGFGAAFMDELKHPRIADEHEVERVTSTRVLATVRPRAPDPDRGRRMADREAPPYFDPAADGYQLAYLHVARTGASRLMLTIAGEETPVAAVIAANLAAIAVDEARSTIIVDTDSTLAPVAAALRIHAEPGVADILESSAGWAEAVAPARIGRDQVIDVIPSGLTSRPPNVAAVTDLFRREGARLSRHYEAVVLVATIAQASSGLPAALPISDTILCARLGHTRIADLCAALDGVRLAGGNPLGTILWDATPPAFPTVEKLARAPRPVHTEEMRALTNVG
ncbi:MAG TPA: hypothetical protein VF159_03920 [Gemmatimonadaceae bacterium]